MQLEEGRSDLLTSKQLNQIRSECWDARSKWMDLGLELYLAKSDLEAIQAKYKWDVDKCFTEMLCTWLNTNPRPTLTKIIAALRQKTVGYHHLAEKLEKEGLNQSEAAMLSTAPTHDEITTETLACCFCLIFVMIILLGISVFPINFTGIHPSSAHVSPKDCFVTGKGLETPEIGERAIAILYIVDQERKPYARKIETARCEVIHESTGNKLDCSIEKIDMNQYRISYQPTSRGIHQLHIKVEGEHIKESPLVVFVGEGYTSLSFYSSSISMKISSSVTYLIISTTLVSLLFCTTSSYSFL